MGGAHAKHTAEVGLPPLSAVRLSITACKAEYILIGAAP
jgi:hypothetical protein